MTTRLIEKFHLQRKGIISIIGGGGKTSLMFCLARELADSGKKVLTTTTTKIFMPKKDQSPFTLIAGSINELVARSKSQIRKYYHFSAGSKHDPETGKLSGFSPDIIDQLWKAAVFDWIIVEADGARRKPIKATASHEPVVSDLTTHLILVTGLDAVGKTLDEKHVHRAEIFSRNTGLSMGEIMDEKIIAACIGIEIKKAASLAVSSSNLIFLNKAETKARKDSGKKIAGLLKKNDTIDRIFTASLKEKVIALDVFDYEEISQP